MNDGAEEWRMMIDEDDDEDAEIIVEMILEMMPR